MKPGLKIIDTNFKLLGEIDNYESLLFIKRFNTYGEFELRINIYKQNTDKLQKGNIIFLSKNKAAVIEHREIDLGERGKASEILLIKGFSLESIFNRRITLPPKGIAQDSITADAESVIKHYIEKNVTAPEDIVRKIDLIELAPNFKRGPQIKWDSRHKNLSEELQQISFNSNLGLQMYLDFSKKKFIFDVLEGRDLTTKQTKYSPVIFSYDFDNIKSQHYIDSDIGYKNVAYVGGQGEGENRKIEVVGELKGLDRREEFIDARDINENLKDRGIQRLNEVQSVKTLEGQILNTGPFKYERDWNLGDIVTVQNKNWGVTMDSRVTEIKEIYEEKGFNIEVTFGNKMPNVLNKIKDKLNQISKTITK